MNPRKWLHSDRSRNELKLNTTGEILEYIQKDSAEKGESQTVDWECSVTAEHLHDDFVKECNKWSEATYQGDWDKVLKVCYIVCRVLTDPRCLTIPSSPL